MNRSISSTFGIKHSEKIEDFSEKLGSNLTSTFETGIISPKVDVKSQRLTVNVQKSQGTKFVGINAELWRVMSKKEGEKTVLNQYLCNICTYFHTQTETLDKHQESHRIKCYTCNYCKDAVKKKNNLAGPLKNHHENHEDIRQINVEALSNPHATFCTNKLICKEKDESEALVDAAEKELEPRIKFNKGVNTNSRLRKSFHSASEICSSNIKWDNCKKQLSCINTVSFEQLILPEELRQTADTIAELEEKASENCRRYVSSKEETTCVSLKLRKEVNIERKKQVQKEVVKRNDESSKPLSKSV